MLTGAGLDPADSGDRVPFRGADPVVPSPRRLGGSSAIALADRNGSPAPRSPHQAGARVPLGGANGLFASIEAVNSPFAPPIQPRARWVPLT